MSDLLCVLDVRHMQGILPCVAVLSIVRIEGPWFERDAITVCQIRVLCQKGESIPYGDRGIAEQADRASRTDGDARVFLSKA